MRGDHGQNKLAFTQDTYEDLNILAAEESKRSPLKGNFTTKKYFVSS